MNEINFFFVIRFSLRLSPDWGRKVFGNEKNREQWFQYRAQLYRQTLNKSLAAQTRKADGVYLLMDHKDKKLFERYVNCSGFVPVFCKSIGEGFSLIKEDIEAKGIKSNFAFSRVDSDDLLHEKYVELVCNELANCNLKFDEQNLIWLVATDGYRFDLSKYQRIYYNCSPFLTSFSLDWPEYNVYSIMHENVTQKTSLIRLVTSEPLWMQIIHGSNVSNSFTKQKDIEIFNKEKRANFKLSGYFLEDFSSHWSPSGYNLITLDFIDKISSLSNFFEKKTHSNQVILN